MDSKRRDFLKNSGAAGVALVALGTGLLNTGVAIAAEPGKGQTLSGAMSAAGYAGAINSSQIVIRTPEIAENGGVVPVEVSSNIPGTTSMAIFVDKNPNPLAATYGFMEGVDPSVTTRVKMSESSQVRVAVKAGGKTYVASKEVKVTMGGCGGGNGQ